MEETRTSKYGRFLAEWVNTTINSRLPSERAGYRSRLIDELNNYSFEPRKKRSC